jgi:hypothetical protein
LAPLLLFDLVTINREFGAGSPDFIVMTVEKSVFRVTMFYVVSTHYSHVVVLTINPIEKRR